MPLAIPIATVIAVVILLTQFVITSSKTNKEQSTTEKGLIVIPGLGRRDRLDTVLWNLRKLQEESIDDKSIIWDCIVYIYAPREDRSFWEESISHPLEELRKLCNVVEVPNKRVTENLYMVQPTLVRMYYSYVFILLDDCKIMERKSFDLNRMVRILQYNNLTVASPLIAGANKGGGQKFRNIMQTPPQPGTEGYISSFVEIFVWVMTIPAYTALWELLFPTVNPYAWGYDFWYDGYASEHVSGHKMGIVSSMVVKHVQNVNDPALGRTDNADVKVKWNAVLAQERHYRMYKHINLGHYRAHLNIDNTSWNGAVKGYIPSFRI